MQWISDTRFNDSPAQPIDRIGFDVVRAIVGARQAVCPTVQALQAVTLDTPAHSDPTPDATIALLAGRCTVAVKGGSFASAQPGDRSCTGENQYHG
jgi:hypothetical protein